MTVFGKGILGRVTIIAYIGFENPLKEDEDKKNR